MTAPFGAIGATTDQEQDPKRPTALTPQPLVAPANPAAPTPTPGTHTAGQPAPIASAFTPVNATAPAPAAQPAPQLAAIPTWSAAPAPAPAAPPAPGPSTVGAPGTPTAPYAANAQYQAATALSDAGKAPDRAALAAQTLQQLTEAGDPAFQQAQRQIGQSAAKFGRIGSGVTTSQLGDVATARQANLDNLSKQLATESAGKTLDDRLALANTALSQYGTFSGQDNASNRLALDAELGRGGLDVQRESNATQNANAAADRALRDKLGTGDLDLSRLTADRNFLLDDRTAEAYGALGGADYSTPDAPAGGAPIASDGVPAGFDAQAVQSAPPAEVAQYIKEGLASGQLDENTAAAMASLAGLDSGVSLAPKMLEEKAANLGGAI